MRYTLFPDSALRGDRLWALFWTGKRILDSLRGFGINGAGEKTATLHSPKPRGQHLTTLFEIRSQQIFLICPTFLCCLFFGNSGTVLCLLYGSIANSLYPCDRKLSTGASGSGKRNVPHCRLLSLLAGFKRA